MNYSNSKNNLIPECYSLSDKHNKDNYVTNKCIEFDCNDIRMKYRYSCQIYMTTVYFN